MIPKLYPLKLYLTKRVNLLLLSSSFLLNTATWVWLFWEIKPQKDPIFLHYNILFGVDYIGPWWQIIFLPLTGLLILLLNALIGWLLYHKYPFISQILNAVSVLIQIYILIASALLIFLNV